MHVGLDNVGHDVLRLLDPLQPSRDRDEHVSGEREDEILLLSSVADPDPVPY